MSTEESFITIYGYEHIDSRSGRVRGLPGEVYESAVKSAVPMMFQQTERAWVVNKTRIPDLRAAFEVAGLRYRYRGSDNLPIPTLTEAQARHVVDSIKESLAGVQVKIIRAWEGRAWVGLGYSSWGALCDAEFGFRLAITERRVAAQGMREVGMSTRAIGSALSVDHATVVRDLQSGGAFAPPERELGSPDLRSGGQFCPPDPEPGDAFASPGRRSGGEFSPPEPAPVTGLDGKSYMPSRTPTWTSAPDPSPWPEESEPIQGIIVASESEPEPQDHPALTDCILTMQSDDPISQRQLDLLIHTAQIRKNR